MSKEERAKEIVKILRGLLGCGCCNSCDDEGALADNRLSELFGSDIRFKSVDIWQQTFELE